MLKFDKIIYILVFYKMGKEISLRKFFFFFTYL